MHVVEVALHSYSTSRLTRDSRLMTARLRMDQQAASSGMFQREIRPNPWIGWLVSARSSKNRSASYVGVPKNIDHSSSHQKVLYEYYSSTRRVLSYDSTSTGSFMFHILEGNFLAVLIFVPTNGGLITTTHQTVPTARNRNECVSVRRKSQLRGRHIRRKCCPTSRVFLVRLTIL